METLCLLDDNLSWEKKNNLVEFIEMLKRKDRL